MTPQKNKTPFEFTKKVFWFYLFIIGFLYCNFQREIQNEYNFNCESLKISKKGNLKIIYWTGGRKSKTHLYGVNIENNLVTDVIYEELTSKFIPDSGSLYPIWFTDSNKFVAPQVHKSKQEMTVFFTAKYNSDIKKIRVLYIILTFVMVTLFICECVQFKKRKAQYRNNSQTT